MRKPLGSWIPSLKVLWYVLATVLILSLPTFSTYLPDAGSFRASEPEAVSSVPPAGDGGVQQPGYAAATATSSASPSRGGFVSKVTPRRAGQASKRPALTPSKRGLFSPDSSPAAAAPTSSSTSVEAGTRDEAEDVQPMLEALSELDQEFESTYGELFSDASDDRYSRSNFNPFQNALFGGGGGGSTSGDSGDSGDSGGDSGGEGGDSSGGGDNGGGTNPNPPSTDPSPPSDEEPEPEPVFDFLLAGDLGSETGEYSGSVAAHLGGGNFLMPEGNEFPLFPGLVGGPAEVDLFREEEQVVTGSLEQERRLDLALLQPTRIGSLIEHYTSTSLRTNVLAQGLFLYKAIRTFAFFDIDRDDELELVAALFQNRNLLIYEIVEGEFAYSRELVLPFSPSVLVMSRESAGLRNSYLQVFDADLSRSVTFSTKFPGVYSFSAPPTFRGRRSYLLESSEEGAAGLECFVLLYEDRLVLGIEQEGSLVPLGSFSTRFGYPLLVLGDYLSDGTIQLLVRH